jgi:hypothetical protein
MDLYYYRYYRYKDKNYQFDLYAELTHFCGHSRSYPRMMIIIEDDFEQPDFTKKEFQYERQE